jgi:hypothetical protein
MARSQTLDVRLSSLIDALAAVRTEGAPQQAIERFRADAEAARFHLNRQDGGPVIVALLGGTGTGKSTLFNRILGADLTATSFRRTYTAGPVAAAQDEKSLPPKWLGVEMELVDPSQLPARGKPDALMLVQANTELTQRIVLVDTPDLDGDQPLHHAQADRVFRWADALLFLVTPEKYQMTELLPYYRLAARFRIPRLFAMNKAEAQAVVEDYAQQLTSRGDIAQSGISNAMFAIPRDDASYEPPAEINLQALRAALASLKLPSADYRRTGAHRRVGDLLGRLRDQVITPLRSDRREADRLILSLRAMESPTADVDVNPLMTALQRRLQQRSILYLMGPGRMLDRVRQVPGLIARLPRSTWDLLRGGQSNGNSGTAASADGGGAIDFRTALVDQFAIVQSRIDDVIHSSERGRVWTGESAAAYAETKLPPEQAAAIADEELEVLKKWMNERWNATPRDTAIIKKLIKHLPGGEKLTGLSEAAPYLVIAASVITTHALFGADIAVFGAYSLVTWLTEKASNEVASRARATNQRIAERFAKLAHVQIQTNCQWLDARVPAASVLDQIEKMADGISDEVGVENGPADLR